MGQLALVPTIGYWFALGDMAVNATLAVNKCSPSRGTSAATVLEMHAWCHFVGLAGGR